MSKRTAMTKAQIREIAADYVRSLPGWIQLEADLLVREVGPVVQCIGFERLSWGDYRLQSGCYALCVPDRGAVAGQAFLEGSVRSVDPRAHDRMREQVLAAIRLHYLPCVDRPLDPSEVLELFEKTQEPPAVQGAAALNAYFDKSARAIEWCNRFVEMVDARRDQWADYDVKGLRFLRQLQEWIEADVARERLQAIVASERKNWRLHR